jgi:hypothetical protein
MLALTRVRVLRLATAAVLSAGLSVAAAAPAAAFGGTACSTPAMTQAFASWGDSN